MNKDYQPVPGEVELVQEPSAPPTEKGNYSNEAVAVAIPTEVLGATTGAPVAYAPVPGYIPNTAPVNNVQYVQTPGTVPVYGGQPGYPQYGYPAGYPQPLPPPPLQTPGNGAMPHTGFVAGGSPHTSYSQQSYVNTSPMNSTSPAMVAIATPALICGIPAIYCGGGCCGLCCIFIILIIVLAIVLPGSSDNIPSDYLYYRVYRSSSCAGSPIYQYAYPTGTCLTYYEASLSQTSSYKLAPFPFNVTKTSYNDGSCATPEISRVGITPNQCSALPGYPGYSVYTFYQSGDYQSLDNSFRVIGYRSNVCQTVGEMFSLVYGQCIPRTTTTSVRYTYTASYRTCSGSSDRAQTCTDHPAVRYEENYSNTVCSGSYSSRNDLSGSPDCDLSDSSYTTSPYRSYRVADCFQ